MSCLQLYLLSAPKYIIRACSWCKEDCSAFSNHKKPDTLTVQTGGPEFRPPAPAGKVGMAACNPNSRRRDRGIAVYSHTFTGSPHKLLKAWASKL